MFCKSCGARLYKNAKFCAHCGDKVEEIEDSISTITNEEQPSTNNEVLTSLPSANTQSEVIEKKKFSGKAITGFVLSIVGLFFAGIPCGIIGIIFSSIALGDIKRKNYGGKGLAIAGLVVSIITLVLSIFSFINKIIHMFLPILE